MQEAFDNSEKIARIFKFLTQNRERLFLAGYDSEDGRQEFMVVFGNENIRIVLRVPGPINDSYRIYISRVGHMRSVISNVNDILFYDAEGFLHGLPVNDYTTELNGVWDE